MPTIQSADLWRESGRYDDYGKEMLRIRDRHERDMLYGPTNEEMITEIFRANVRSYKDLPLNLYHIQWKFRDEVRPRFGVMRSREFLMKDAYSFDLDAAGRAPFLQQDVRRLSAHLLAPRAHRHSDGRRHRADRRRSVATNSSSSPTPARARSICHKDYLEFAPPPESIDFDSASAMQGVFDKWTSLYAATSEKHDAAAFARIEESARISARGIEVGHIFYFGTKYSEPMKAVVNGPDGKERSVHMGSYGIGPSRLVAALIEAGHDEAGMIWPEAAAPFAVGLINLKVGDAACDGACARIYAALGKAGVEVLYDDRDERPGAKFAAMDLIGLPHQVIVGPKSLAEGKVEIKNRRTGNRELVAVEAAIARLGVDRVRGRRWRLVA